MNRIPALAVGVTACWLTLAAPVFCADTGFQDEVRVQGPTRLDWEFPLAGLPGEAVRLPRDYRSDQQRYQLFVPSDYEDSHPWPLVVFLSPGDDPFGWRFWKNPCEKGKLLFCAAYGAGNNCVAGQRCRIILDMLDDVRRRYKIDPDQTYITGFTGGASLACTLAFALPEYCGGVVAVGGCEGLNRLDYLRQRVRERLAVALVDGESERDQRKLEEYFTPYFTDVGIFTRCWRVPDLGKAMPNETVLSEVLAWLADDLPRRRADTRKYPGLAASATAVDRDVNLATRILGEAVKDLENPERIRRGAALLEGVVARWPITPPAERARNLLDEVHGDPRRNKWLAEQKAAEEKRDLTAQARAHERAGDLRAAADAWGTLATNYLGSPDGRQAARELRRVRELVDNAPYLGLALEGASNVIQSVAAQGPADKAGLRRGDHLLTLGGQPCESPAELRLVLGKHKAGDKLAVEVRRADKTVQLILEVGRHGGQ
jgi:hypothetical protein